MRNFGCLLLFISLFVFFSACEEDEEALLSYRQDLAELYADGLGIGTRLLRDDGVALAVLNRPGGLSRDTIYRVCAMYTEEPQGVRLSHLAFILSPCPRRFSESSVVRHPLALKAVWRGGRYVNLLVALQTSGDAHRFAFADKGVETTPQGYKIARVELCHDQNGNEAYYTREAYLSCPVWPYADVLQAGRDSVELIVHTYDGPQVRRLAY